MSTPNVVLLKSHFRNVRDEVADIVVSGKLLFLCSFNGKIDLPCRTAVRYMAESIGTLHFICGRLASGKTTLARALVAKERAILICEDVWLSKLVDEISNFEDYLKWSRRCRSVMESLVVDILRAGSSVVLDFAGNTPTERKWGRSLFERAEADHVLHYLDVPEIVCLARLKLRNETKPEGLYFATTSEEEFLVIARWFQPPSSEEGFCIHSY